MPTESFAEDLDNLTEAGRFFVHSQNASKTTRER
jgi:hypothetical protein